MIRLVALLLFTLLSTVLHASSENDKAKYSLSGYVKDAKTGEELIGATIYIEEIKGGTITNVYGFYSITLVAGKYTVSVSFVGYETLRTTIELSNHLRKNFELQPTVKFLSEVKITAESGATKLKRAEMSLAKMDSRQIEKIPALMGEVDVIKALQLLPGVTSVSEGSSGFSVRGGGIDQNLILLDEASVYNASHLLGFFSVFNNDAIKDLKLYKGDIPAEYGGRMSSVLDIRMKEGNQRKISGNAAIGTISGKFLLEGPFWEDNTSFLVAGRRTWADLFLPLARDTSLHDNKLFFYDLNSKINHKINDNNRLYLSGYFGRDIFRNQFSDISFGNSTFTSRWNHIFNPKLFSNLTVTYSNYYYGLSSTFTEANSYLWEAEMKNWTFKADLGFFATPNISLKYGIHAIFHEFQPGHARGIGSQSILNDIRIPGKNALEAATYISNEHKLIEQLTLKYGVRLSGFANYNSDSVYFYDSNYNLLDIKNYRNRFFGTHVHFEPRAGMVYSLSENSSIKSFYSRNVQYLQMAQNSTAGTPLDLWFSASNNVKPQISDQVGLGYFHNFWDQRIETSVEVFYKYMQNSIDFKEYANLLLNSRMEGELRYGYSYAYGAEFLIKYTLEKLSGWIGYTYSVAKRKIDLINNGKKYYAPFDKPHDFAAVFNYEITSRVSLGANWVYSSGIPVTFPAGKAVIGGVTIPVYTGRNEYRMPAYHRLDVAITLKNKQKPNRNWQSEFNFSIYNAYNRKNAWAINFIEDKENPGRTKAIMTYLFPIIPAISYNIKF